MHGVVLWSEKADGSAVIWCEDQGDLAYCSDASADQGCTPQLAVGDLVEFDLAEECAVRKAINTRLIAGGVYPEIVRELDIMAAKAQQVMREDQHKRECASKGDNIVSFMSASSRRTSLYSPKG